MNDIEQWATSATVSDLLYWESSFPGHGEKIVRLTAPFQDWKPIFGETDNELERDILAGTNWFKVAKVSVNPFSAADVAQGTVYVSFDKAFWETLEERRPRTAHDFDHAVNDAVGNAFGPVVGGRVPSVMLRAWLYEIIVDAIVCELLGEHELFAALEKILQRWRNGNYLIGFDTTETSPKAVIIVADP